MDVAPSFWVSLYQCTSQKFISRPHGLQNSCITKLLDCVKSTVSGHKPFIPIQKGKHTLREPTNTKHKQTIAEYITQALQSSGPHFSFYHPPDPTILLFQKFSYQNWFAPQHRTCQKNYYNFKTC